MTDNDAKPGYTARLVRAQLRRKRVDLAPLAELAGTIGVSTTTLHDAVAHHPDLGICAVDQRRFVWWLPAAPLDAGFEPIILTGRLVLRLPAENPTHQPLHISGHHLGAATDVELAAPELCDGGMGELGYTIARLSLLADTWLAGTDQTDPCGKSSRRLFRLIARTWRAGPEPIWSIGRLRIHRAEHSQPVGSRPWNGGAETAALELVVWADAEDNLHLVNVYPAGTYQNLFGMDSDR